MKDHKKLIIAVVIIFIIFAAIIFLVVINGKAIVSTIQTKIWDAASELKIMQLHPQMRDKVRQFINNADQQGIKLRVTSGYRSWDEQAALYAQGRTAPGAIVTNAKPGDSYHNYGLAVDVVPIVNGVADWSTDWNKIAGIGKPLGFVWGGEFTTITDKPHFEMHFGNTLASLKDKYNSGDLQDGYINLA